MAKGLCIICCSEPKSSLCHPGLVANFTTNNDGPTTIDYRRCTACNGNGWIEFGPLPNERLQSDMDEASNLIYMETFDKTAIPDWLRGWE